MLIPIRCFSCGKVLADKYDVFVQRSQELERDVQRAEEEGKEHPAHSKNEAFDRVKKDALMTEMGLTRYCCRRHLLGQVDMMELI